MIVALSALLALQALTPPVDTVAVLSAAMERSRLVHAFEGKVAGFEASRRVPGSTRLEPVDPSLQSDLATRFGMVPMSHADAVKCDDFTPGRDLRSRSCEISGADVLIGAVLNDVGEDSAVVTVSVLTPHRNSIFSTSITYELVRIDRQWTVSQNLSQGSS